MCDNSTMIYAITGFLGLIGLPAAYYVLLQRQRCKSDSVSHLLICSTRHARFQPIKNIFRYTLLYIGIPLSADTSTTYSNRLLSIRSSDYLGQDQTRSIREKLFDCLQAHGIDKDDLLKVYMVTMPRFCGYAFNPLTVFYIYDSADTLKVVVLDVKNTFGEEHIYVCTTQDKQNSDLSDTVNRQFHVSPFNDRAGTYQVRAKDPLYNPQNPNIDVSIVLANDEDQKIMSATLQSIKSAPLKSPLTFLLLLRYAFSIFLTMPRILFEAWKLHYKHKLPVYERPEPVMSVGTVGCQKASVSDRFFRNLLLSYLHDTGASVSIAVVPNGDIHSDCEVQINVLSWTFFTRLFLLPSPKHSLWFDSILPPSPLFTVNDRTKYLALFRGSSTLRDVQILRQTWLPQPPSSLATKKIETNYQIVSNPLDIYATARLGHSNYKQKLRRLLISDWITTCIFKKLAYFVPGQGPGLDWDRVLCAEKCDGVVL